MPAGIICPKPTRWRLLSCFLFKSGTSCQTAALCDYSPSADSSPPTTNRFFSIFLCSALYHISSQAPFTFLCSALCPISPRLSFHMVSDWVQLIGNLGKRLETGGKGGQDTSSLHPPISGTSTSASLHDCSPPGGRSSTVPTPMGSANKLPPHVGFSPRDGHGFSLLLVSGYLRIPFCLPNPG